MGSPADLVGDPERGEPVPSGLRTSRRPRLRVPSAAAALVGAAALLGACGSPGGVKATGATQTTSSTSLPTSGPASTTTTAGGSTATPSPGSPGSGGTTPTTARPAASSGGSQAPAPPSATPGGASSAPGGTLGGSNDTRTPGEQLTGAGANSIAPFVRTPRLCGTGQAARDVPAGQPRRGPLGRSA